MTTINSTASDVNEVKRKFVDLPASLQPAITKLTTKIDKEASFEPPVAYWRALWAKPHLKPSQTKITLQVQGSVVRLKSKKPSAQAGATFERDWNQKPDDWGENFLLDGYDRLNPHDRAIYCKKPRSGNKAEIKEFSKASRRNLMDRMCSLKVDEWIRSQFITLTYHNEYPDPEGAKAHLRRFYKRICYYCTRSNLNYKPAEIWRIEPQDRGAPHFHLFLFNAPKIPKHMLLQWWQEITGDPTITQLDREFLTTRRKAMNYLSKYISKPDESQIKNSHSHDTKVDRIAQFSKEFIAHKRVEREERYELPAGKEFNPSAIIQGFEGHSSDVGAQLDIALYWAKAGRYWGSEGLTDEMYADINEITVDVTHDGLLRFVALLETTFPWLVDRWSFGFRIFTYDKPADSIWEIASALMSPALARSRSPSEVQKLVHWWNKIEPLQVPWWVSAELHAYDPKFIADVDFCDDR